MLNKINLRVAKQDGSTMAGLVRLGTGGAGEVCES